MTWNVSKWIEDPEGQSNQLPLLPWLLSTDVTVHSVYLVAVWFVNGMLFKSICDLSIYLILYTEPKMLKKTFDDIDRFTVHFPLHCNLDVSDVKGSWEADLRERKCVDIVVSLFIHLSSRWETFFVFVIFKTQRHPSQCAHSSVQNICGCVGCEIIIWCFSTVSYRNPIFSPGIYLLLLLTTYYIFQKGEMPIHF